jgi:hypothetical protein
MRLLVMTCGGVRPILFCGKTAHGLGFSIPEGAQLTRTRVSPCEGRLTGICRGLWAAVPLEGCQPEGPGKSKARHLAADQRKPSGSAIPRYSFPPQSNSAQNTPGRPGCQKRRKWRTSTTRFDRVAYRHLSFWRDPLCVESLVTSARRMRRRSF